MVEETIQNDAEYEEELGFQIEGLRVLAQRRVNIPANIRDEYDLVDCYIDATVRTDDGTTFPLADAHVGPQARFVITATKSRLYGVETGDQIDVQFEGVVARE